MATTTELLRSENEDGAWTCYTRDNQEIECQFPTDVALQEEEVSCQERCIGLSQLQADDGTTRDMPLASQTIQLDNLVDYAGQRCTLSFRAIADAPNPVNLMVFLGPNASSMEISSTPSSDSEGGFVEYTQTLLLPEDLDSETLDFRMAIMSEAPSYQLFIDQISLVVESSTSTSPIASASAESATSSSSQHNNRTARTTGAIVGALAGLVFLVAGVLVFVWFRRRRCEAEIKKAQAEEEKQHGFIPITHTISSSQSYYSGTGKALSTSPQSYQSFNNDTAMAFNINLTNDDDITTFAAANRAYITPALEAKLRAASYHPNDDPSLISDTVWMEKHDVGAFELNRLKELYNRRTRHTLSNRSSETSLDHSFKRASDDGLSTPKT